jgi:hypothetical protein
VWPWAFGGGTAHERNYSRCHFCTEVQSLGFQSAPSPESGLGTEGGKNCGGRVNVCLISEVQKLMGKRLLCNDCKWHVKISHYKCSWRHIKVTMATHQILMTTHQNFNDYTSKLKNL